MTLHLLQGVASNGIADKTDHDQLEICMLGQHVGRNIRDTVDPLLAELAWVGRASHPSGNHLLPLVLTPTAQVHVFVRSITEFAQAGQQWRGGGVESSSFAVWLSVLAVVDERDMGTCGMRPSFERRIPARKQAT